MKAWEQCCGPAMRRTTPLGCRAARESIQCQPFAFSRAGRNAPMRQHLLRRYPLGRACVAAIAGFFGFPLPSAPRTSGTAVIPVALRSGPTDSHVQGRQFFLLALVAPRKSIRDNGPKCRAFGQISGSVSRHWENRFRSDSLTKYKCFDATFT